GSAGLHERADAAADGAHAGAAGEPGPGRAVAIRGAVPGPEPDHHEAGPRRGRERAGVGGVHGRRGRRGRAAVGAGVAAVPARETGDFRLIAGWPGCKRPALAGGLRITPGRGITVPG